MAHILIMPRQGNTVESCIIVDWKVQEGAAVTAETPVCDVETDKATFEVPAGATGTILKILHTSGEDVPVLEPIAVIGQAGEDWQAALGSEKRGEASPPTAAPQSGSSAPPLSGGLPPATPPAAAAEPLSSMASPRARNLATKEALSLEMVTVTGTGPGGRIIERDIRATLETRPGLTAAAKAAGPGTLPPAGSGIGGRITVAEWGTGNGEQGTGSMIPSPRSPVPDPQSPVPSPQSPIPIPRSPIPDPQSLITETPIKGIRKLIADRMFQSLAESAQFTLNASAPAGRMQTLRGRMKNSGEELGLSKITVNDLILFAVSRLLPRYPFMNAHKIGDTLRTFERVHLGVAVDTPRGLMVPVLRNANLLPLTQISSEAKRLAVACQNGSIKADELSGSTFTVTNLGSLGISAFTPVLNAPEVGILGVCGIELKPLALPEAEITECNNGVRFEPHISFSLTINHQVVDGAPAARFLKALGEAVAEIDLWLAL